MFYQLQTSPGAVSTFDLTQTLGWKEKDRFMTLDATEFKDHLIEGLFYEFLLRSRSSDHSFDGVTLAKQWREIFLGKRTVCFKCINVDHEHHFEEDFWGRHHDCT